MLFVDTQNVHEAQLRREAFLANREKEMWSELKLKQDELANSLTQFFACFL